VRTRLTALWLCLLSGIADARPGGGQSFSRGGGGGGFSSHGGSGGFSGGGGGFGDLLFLLFFSHPLFGILLVLAIGYVVYRFRSQGLTGSATVESGAPFEEPPGGEGQEGESPRRALESLRADDPAFSEIAFEDFLYALYAQAHEARGTKTLERLAPYLTAEARATLASSPLELREVRQVVVGGLTLVGVSGLEPGSDRVQVGVRFESNYTEVTVAGAAQTYWAVEVWSLSRLRTARSKPPAGIRALACPSCGAPLDQIRDGRCSYCHKAVDTGEFDWIVDSIEVLERSPTAPSLLETGGGALEPPTLRDPDLEERLAALQARDPGFTWEGFEARLQTIFSELQSSWSTLQWERARPYLSDRLYLAESYWIDSYRAQHLRNVTANARLERVELVRVGEDAYHDTLTVRLFASGLDYTVEDPGGRVVSGSASVEKAYSEYWTLMRGHETKGPSSASKACPKCGAPLTVTMAGECSHCRAHVTSGEFDWVLSRIEQPEAYEG
jgi:predicted lipid-binding transport protein (Tim44 family)